MIQLELPHINVLSKIDLIDEEVRVTVRVTVRRRPLLLRGCSRLCVYFVHLLSTAPHRRRRRRR